MRCRRLGTRSGSLALCLLLAGLAGGCTSDSSGPPSEADSDRARETAEAMDLDVLVFNIEYGGNASTDKVMRSLDADIIGVLESYNRLPEIAEKTGYPYYNVGLQLLSKYPIHEPSGAGGLYALVEVQPGYAVAFFNTHLDYVAYGPKLLSSGMPVQDVIASENEIRTSSMDILLPSLAETAEAGYPTFLTGDFNQPSSLDYTGETIGTREGVDKVVPWPVSEALFDIDFRDTFREVHPDPVADPGLTHGDPDLRHGGGDRIDYVYAGGPVETLDSQLVGEAADPLVDIGFEDWTSDHRAVLSTFELEPLALPTTVSLDRRMLTAGDEVTVHHNTPGVSQATVAVVPEGGDAPQEELTSQSSDNAVGTMSFDTAELEPGGYDVVLLDEAGLEIARNEFWVRSRKADVQVSTDRSTYGAADPVEVAWEDGPANRWDWIGVYRAGAADPEEDDYLLWGYTGGHDSGAVPPSVMGSMILNGSSRGRPWPLPPGDYVVHYLLTDRYQSAGRAEFTVR